MPDFIKRGEIVVEILHVEEFSNSIGKIKRIYIKKDGKEYCISECPNFSKGKNEVLVFESKNLNFSNNNSVLNSREETAENCLRNIISGQEEICKR